MRSRSELLNKLARDRNMTIRGLLNIARAARDHLMLVGTPTAIADEMERWFRAGACDGFNIMPAWFPAPLEDFAANVVLILQERGLFRRDYSGRPCASIRACPAPPTASPKEFPHDRHQLEDRGHPRYRPSANAAPKLP